MKRVRRGGEAFTIIELLVVVAIIAILAAIAVPNFLEAQTRSKTSRMKSDMRTVASALEIYSVDHMRLPLSQFYNLPGAVNCNYLKQDEVTDPVLNVRRRVLERLSTPVAYMTSSYVPDLFRPLYLIEFTLEHPDGEKVQFATADGYEKDHYMYQYVKYASISKDSNLTYILLEAGMANTFVLISAGPTRTYTAVAGPVIHYPGVRESVASAQFYDPTNGTIWPGSLFRVGGTLLDRNRPLGRLVEMMRR